MKGVLLHGGHGVRLQPLTLVIPKQLIPIAGKPVSQYCIEKMRDAGIKDIAVILGDCMPHEVRNYYGDGSKFGVHFEYISQGDPKGLAHACSLAEHFVGNEPFIMYLGDNMLEASINDYVKEFQANSADATILLTAVFKPERHGVAKFNPDGSLAGFVEKPKVAPSNLIIVGVYLFRPSVFNAIRHIHPSPRGELEITDAIQYLIDHGGKVEHRILPGWWLDIASWDNILEASMFLKMKSN